MNLISTTIKPLSNDQLKTHAPSIFAHQAHASRSERYSYCPTIDVLGALRKAGYVPVQAFQSRVHKDFSRIPFTKHLIRLRDRRFVEADLKPDAVIPDIILTNSHDGTSAFALEAGLYRLVCSNGMVIRSQDFGTLRVPHSGKIIEKVMEGVRVITDHVPAIMRATKEWDKIKLNPRQRTAMANKALEMRFHGKSPLTAAQALEARRNEDEAPTLWRTFNVLQENLLTGGQQGKTASGRTVRVRRVTSVNNSLHYNRSLWLIAEAVANRS